MDINRSGRSHLSNSNATPTPHTHTKKHKKMHIQKYRSITLVENRKIQKSIDKRVARFRCSNRAFLLVFA